MCGLMALHWLPVDYHIIYKILLLVYKAINGFSSSYISNLLSFCVGFLPHIVSASDIFLFLYYFIYLFICPLIEVLSHGF